MTVEKKAPTIGELLVAQKKQIEAALPKHMTADRMLRIVMTEIRKNPKLKQCTSQSLIGAVIQCSQLGLEPGLLGHSYLIPYDKKEGGRVVETECQFMVGYKGMIDLSRRSGQVASISVHAVFDKDHFVYSYGLSEKCEHVPAEKDRGEFKGVYGVIRYKDGSYQFEYMSKNDIDKIRERSKAKNNGPWVTDYIEMARKTIIRHMFKYMPISIEIQKAVALDEAAERGEQENSIIIDGEFEVEQTAALTEKEPTTLDTTKINQTKTDKVAQAL